MNKIQIKLNIKEPQTNIFFKNCERLYIDWGDDTSIMFITDNLPVSHFYENPGDFICTIYFPFYRFKKFYLKDMIFKRFPEMKEITAFDGLDQSGNFAFAKTYFLKDSKEEMNVRY